MTASTIAFVTLGCAKNEADSNNMRALVRAAGLLEVADVNSADFILINTCAFITAATEESLEAILEATELDNVKSGKSKLIVSGCMPSRYGAELATELPEVAAFVDVNDEAGIVEVLRQLGADRHESATLLTDTNKQPWAYVKISDGCSRRCSFCTIPNIRGAYHSYPFEQIDAQIHGLVSQGVKEIILIGQDTGIWGTDLKQPKQSSPQNLAELLRQLATTYPDTWFRVMYLQPQGITAQLLAVMAKHPNICNYLDIPLQHANARVIKEMHRSGNGQQYLDLIHRIRAAIPGVSLRTTLIAGFPGETRSDALELEKFIKAAQFDFAGVFTYSQEDGTPAGERADQVPMRTRKARTQRLRDIADVVGFERADLLCDSQQQVLVTGRDEDGLYGRTQGQAPEVDGVVYLTGLGAEHLAIGDLVHVRITEAICYDLYATL